MQFNTRSSITTCLALGAILQLIILMRLSTHKTESKTNRSIQSVRTAAGGVDSDDERDAIAMSERHQCVQDAIFHEMGSHEHRQLRYHTGCCYTPTLHGFFEWAKNHTTCSPAESQIAQPVLQIQVHVAVHPQMNRAKQCLITFIRSWTDSQPLGMTKLNVWVLANESISGPGTTSLFYTEIQQVVVRMATPNVQIRDVSSVAKLMSATNGVSGLTASMWEPPDKRAEQLLHTRLELLRLVILHVEGGVWMEVCTVLLTALPPVLQYVENFGVLKAMSPFFSPLALGLRRGSSTGRAILDFVFQYPKSNDRAIWGPYCTDAGQPCPLNSWYSHPPLAWAFKQRLDIVILPAAFFDPTSECPCSTQACASPKTVSAVNPGGTDFDVLPASTAVRRAQTHALSLQQTTPGGCPPDPTFIPREPCTRYRVSSRSFRTVCLGYNGARRGKISLSLDCARAEVDRDERAAWLHCVNNSVGYLRSSFDAVDGVACIDSSYKSLSFAPCVQGKVEQRWSLSIGESRIRSHGNLCMAAVKTKSQKCKRAQCLEVVLRLCDEKDQAQVWDVKSVPYHGDSRLQIQTSGSKARVGYDVY